MNYTALIIAAVFLVVVLVISQSRSFLFKLFSIDKVRRASSRVKNRTFVEKGYIFNSYALSYMCLSFFIVFEVYIIVELFYKFDISRLLDLLLFALLILLSRSGIWLYFKISGLDIEDEAKY